MVDIARPVSEVFEFLADPSNDTSWRSDVRSVSLKEGSPGQVGAMYGQEVSAMGMAMAGTVELVTRDPEKQLVFRGTTGPIQMSIVYSFESTTDGGTTVAFCARCRIVRQAHGSHDAEADEGRALSVEERSRS